MGRGTSIAVPHHVLFAAGDRVTVRGDRWIVDAATIFGDCTLLSLSATKRHNTPRTCRLLLPFDRPVVALSTAKVQPVTRRRWMRLLQAELSDLRIFGQLRAASRASIDVLPFQLEPALALIAGRASRFLLADEVGLGKTIQAGLMLAELQHRGWCERALIVTPAGLQEQWADELRRRFDIRAAVVDATALSALTRSLPLDVNPWASEPVSIASVDFVKQPEVLRGLCRQVWDMLIVDEAHRASAASLRYDALTALAGRSREVVLLTATPHAGDETAYRALCDLGKLDHGDPMLLFRRTKEQAGLSRTRRVHLLPVRLSADTAAMHRMLADYVARLWQIAHETGSRDVRLVAMVLSKRAFSSAYSLAASIERRLAGLSGSPPPLSQSSLPFDVDEAGDDTPDPVAPAFDRSSEEETALRQLLEITRRAQVDEPKVRALRRLLRRTREPIIVFTEYRDTLKALESAVTDLRKTTTLHGGQTAEERRDSVDAFANGSADLLLATDAGAEGLNLQSRCRLVVNLELPWNPIRLEQRIGRVDRIGQRRTVHAINLFADGTAESTVLARLLHRIDRIHASEIEIAASVIDGAALPAKRPDPVLGGHTESVDLAARARAEASRIRSTRGFEKMPPAFHTKIIPVTVIRSLNLGSNDQALQPSAVWLIRIRIATRAGRLVEDTLVPVRFPFRDGECHGRRRQIRSLTERMLAEFESSVIAFVTRVAEERAGVIARESAEWVTRALQRERRMAGTSAACVVPPIQAGLFDNRELKRRQIAEQLHHSMFVESADRRSLLEAGARAALAHEPEIALVLITC